MLDGFLVFFIGVATILDAERGDEHLNLITRVGKSAVLTSNVPRRSFGASRAGSAKQSQW